MARKPSRNSSQSRRRGKSGGGKSSSPVVKIIICALAVIVAGGLIWGLCTLFSGDYKFKRSDLDAYIAKTEGFNSLSEGASVYVDMSDGMNAAYSTQESKSILQAVINKLAADKDVQFFGLADLEITPLEKSHTELYNYMLNPASYDKQKAPIEKALEKIVKDNKAAVLMTDFEEYKGGVIEHAAYAKKYFIEWLSKGYYIHFYKWNFVEKGKEKAMFIAVFDDNMGSLAGQIANAIRVTNPDIQDYVLGGHDYNYPMQVGYASFKEGGNYHNSAGEDAVTAVMSKGGPEDYICYAQPVATAEGTQGVFAPLDSRYGAYAEYYPLGVTWTDAIKNSKLMQEDGVPEEDMYTHLLSQLYVNFGAQSGYTIDEIEVRTFDMMETMKAVADSASVEARAPEVNIFLKASMEQAANKMGGWKEIFVDFDEQFKGTFMNNIPASNLMRANIVISKVTVNLTEAIDFFSWEDNPSLADSVKETLMAKSSSPQGRVIYSYYLKTIE